MPSSSIVPLRPSDDPIHLDFIRACHQGQSPQRLNHLLGRGANVDLRDEQQWTPLHHAASSGSALTVTHLVDTGADIYAFASRVGTFLHVAAARGSVESVRCLLDAGADVDAFDEWVGTPLHHAAFSGSADTARYLLEKGANVNASSKWVGSPLSIAAARSHLAVVKAFLDHGVDVEGYCGYFASATHMACAAGDLELLLLLLSEVIKDTFEEKFTGKNSESCYAVYHRFLGPSSRSFPAALESGFMEGQQIIHSTPVILAIKHGHLVAVELCLDRVLYVPSLESYGTTWYTEADWRRPSSHVSYSVNLAIQALDVGMLRLLLDRGLAPESDEWLESAMSSLGASQIQQAARDEMDASACISLLLQLGVHNQCVHPKKKGDNTLLMAVMQRQDNDLNYPTAKAILQHGAPVNAVNHSGQTALMIVAGSDHKSRVRCVELLCEYGADVHMQDLGGRTALRYAQKWGGPEDYAEVSRILQYAGRGQRNGSRSASEEQSSLP